MLECHIEFVEGKEGLIIVCKHRMTSRLSVRVISLFAKL